MTPADFRNARKALGHTQHTMAEALGFGKWGFQTVGKMERGEAPISDRTVATVRLMQAAQTSQRENPQP